MGYSSNKLSLRTGQIGGGGPRVWEYFIADSLATICGAGYISDATKKGMLVGDTVMVYFATLNTTGPDQSPSTVARGQSSEFAANPTFATLSVSSISAGAATLLDKQVIGGSATALVGFYGTTPVVQPAATAQSSGASTTITSVGSTSLTTLDVTRINAAFARIEEVRVLTDAIRTALVAQGLIKGAA